MSVSGAEQTAAANSSGRWVSAAATSRPPFDSPQMRELIRRGPAFGDQVLGGRDEVVEDLLLVVQCPGLVRRRAALTTAADGGRDEDAAGFDPRQREGGVRRGQRLTEPAVPVEDRGPRSLDARLLDHAELELGAVRGGAAEAVRLGFRWRAGACDQGVVRAGVAS